MTAKRLEHQGAALHGNNRPIHKTNTIAAKQNVEKQVLQGIESDLTASNLVSFEHLTTRDQEIAIFSCDKTKHES